MQTTILLLILQIYLCTCAKLPPKFEKCNKNNPDFKDCLLRAANIGISRLKEDYEILRIPNLNPFNLTELVINGGDGPVNLKQKFTNCSLYGVLDLHLNQFDFDFEKKELRLAGVVPECLKDCHYEIKGQILLLHIDGRGHSLITLKDLKITDVLPFEEFQKKGKTHIKFTSSSVTLDPGLVIYNFTNQDDKRLSDAVNPVINENWKEIFDDVKSGYAQLIDTIILSVANKFFDRISENEAFE